jgi:hypothetical protein
MKTFKTSLLLLILFLTCACSSSMPGSTTGNGGNNGGNNGGGGSPLPPMGSVSITSLSPGSVVAGSADFTLTIVGTGFPATPIGKEDHPGVWWSGGGPNGTFLTVDFAGSDATQVTATVPASLVQNAGQFIVQASIWHHADDMPKAVSNTLKFKVTK